VKKIVLAYSGGLDTSVILAWLKEQYRCPVVAFIADVGQNEDLAAVQKKARATGADDVRTADLKTEFEREFVHPAIQGRAVYEGGYLLGTSLARPVIGRALVRTAVDVGADAIAHGATGKGNDQVRFELAAAALAPQLEVVAPWRRWEFEGRTQLIEYARAHGIPVTTTAEKPYSMDANLMHISYEGGILEDPWAAPPEEMFQLTVSPQKAPDRPQELEITFEQGVPTIGLAELNKIAGAHGVGRVDVVENRFVGIKSRGVYETPGGTVLHAALRAVESITMDREVMHLRDSLAPRFAQLIYNGFWFSPEMRVILLMIREAMRPVTGTARLRLYKGSVTVVGRKAPRSLYRPDIASFEKAGGYSQKDAEGFIRLQGLRLRGCEDASR
jgi:argininosuccinate synthase